MLNNESNTFSINIDEFRNIAILGQKCGLNKCAKTHFWTSKIDFVILLWMWSIWINKKSVKDKNIHQFKTIRKLLSIFWKKK